MEVTVKINKKVGFDDSKHEYVDNWFFTFGGSPTIRTELFKNRIRTILHKKFGTLFEHSEYIDEPTDTINIDTVTESIKWEVISKSERGLTRYDYY